MLHSPGSFFSDSFAFRDLDGREVSSTAVAAVEGRFPDLRVDTITALFLDDGGERRRLTRMEIHALTLTAWVWHRLVLRRNTRLFSHWFSMLGLSMIRISASADQGEADFVAIDSCDRCIATSLHLVDHSCARHCAFVLKVRTAMGLLTAILRHCSRASTFTYELPPLRTMELIKGDLSSARSRTLDMP